MGRRQLRVLGIDCAGLVFHRVEDVRQPLSGILGRAGQRVKSLCLLAMRKWSGVIIKTILVRPSNVQSCTLVPGQKRVFVGVVREWRVSVMRDKVHYLGRVVAPDEQAAIDKAMAEFRTIIGEAT